jgi:diguanylate cyclase (GGDEF)-like protein
LFDEHIERCMFGRFDSYQQAYTVADRTPSEQDFTDILNDCKQVRILEIGHSAKALMAFAASHNPTPFVPTEAMVEQGSAHGHDRVLQRWEVWKAKTQLKPSPTKVEEREKQQDVILPIYNKAEFELDRVRITGESSEERPCSLLFLDLDKFKSINDNLGHPAGDRALRVCADTLLRACSGKGTVYRNGGDEFCVLLPNHSLDEALAVASRILREARAIRTGELPNGLSASIGAACFPESAGDHNKLLSQADTAMYVSKRAGGNQVSKADSAKGRNSDVETSKAERKTEAPPDKRITEPARDPYTEELKRIAKQVVDFEMTLEGRHVLRHLMINEPVEVGRPLLPEVPLDRAFAQLAIAKRHGLVQHKEEGPGRLRTYWIINPKFRHALQVVLYEGGNN